MGAQSRPHLRKQESCNVHSIFNSVLVDALLGKCQFKTLS